MTEALSYGKSFETREIKEHSLSRRPMDRIVAEVISNPF